MWYGVLVLLGSVALAQEAALSVRGHEDPLQREEAFRYQRAFPFERIPEGARLQALQQLQRMEQALGRAQLLSSQPRWRAIGPFTVGGRIRTVVHHPQREGWVYIGAAAGGIWRTTDGGRSWEPLFDQGNSLSFGALAIDPNNPDVLYAATGEMSNNIDSYLGAGIFKSTDGGQSWSPIGLTHVGAFSKIEVHPRNSNFIVAGATKSYGGFWRSSDGGRTWERTFIGSVTDVSIHPQDTNRIAIGVAGRGVYYTTDAGRTWELRSSGLPSALGRVCVQMAPSAPDTLYALVEQNGSGGIGAIYKSTDGGRSWQLSYQGQADFFNGQGWYNAYIVVHPRNPNLVLAGGIDIYRTTDGGRTWTNVTYGYSGGNVHVDQHAAVFNPLNPDIVYAGNDGGMYRSDDAGATWRPINNGLAVTQFYAMAVDQSKPNTNYGGTQDNGTLGGREGNWSMVAGGDGFYVVVDPTDPDVLYGEFPNGDLWKRNLRTGTFQRITTGIDPNDPGYWSAPLVMDPVDSRTLYHGRRRLYATYDGGGSWRPISPQFSASITAIGVSPADPSVIYIGTARGEVWRTLDGGENWENVGINGLPVRFVTDFALSESDPATVYVTLSGFGAGHVWRSTDYGRTWQNVGVSLPDIPVNAIVLDPLDERRIFVGTDIGVFASLDGGATWFPYGVGLPRAPVVDLAIHHSRRLLRAATHGRSMWEVELPSEPITEPAITAPAGGEVFYAGGSTVVSWYGFTSPVTVEFSPDDGATWRLVAQDVSSTVLRWRIPEDVATLVGRIRVRSQQEPGQVRITPTFTIRQRERGAVLHSGAVAHVPYGIVADGKGGLWTTSFYTPHLYKLNATTLQLEKQIPIPGGDSLYTDLAMDRERGILYVHKLSGTGSGARGIIVVLDTNGQLLQRYNSPCSYPTGLTLLGTRLYAAERDGQQRIYVLDPVSGAVQTSFPNPFQEPLGPRGLCNDGQSTLYHAVTAFPGGSLAAAYVGGFPAEQPAQPRDTIALYTPQGSIMNVRGVEYDAESGDFWVTDFSGNIYKIAGRTVVGVRSPLVQGTAPRLRVEPNPASESVLVWVSCGESTPRGLHLELVDALGKRRALPVGACGKAQQIALSELPTGTYWLLLRSGGTVVASAPLWIVR